MSEVDDNVEGLSSQLMSSASALLRFHRPQTKEGNEVCSRFRVSRAHRFGTMAYKAENQFN